MPEINNIKNPEEELELQGVLEPEIEDISPDELTPTVDVNVPIDPVDTCDIPVEPIPTDGVQCEPIPEKPSIGIDISLGQFFGTLQESIVTIWKYHLSTRKHWIHVELDGLYHRMLGYVDDLIEQYQGVALTEIDREAYENCVVANPTDSEITYLTNLREFIRNGKNISLIQNFSELQSTIDDILSLLDSAIYKLNSFQEPTIQTFEEFCFERGYNKLNEGCECGHCDNDGDDEEE